MSDRVRRLLRVAGTAACVAASAAVLVTAQAAPLRLVSTAWPPFTNAPGQPRFALDLVEAALGRVGMKSTTTIVEPAAFTSSLLGESDGSAAAWRDAERDRALLFSKPYLENRLVLIARKGTDVSAATLGALKGKRIAIVEGYSYGDIENAGPVFVRTKNEEDGLTQLLASRVDYVLMDELVIQYLVSNYEQEARTRLDIGRTALVKRPLYLAIRRSRPDSESIISRFNAQLQGMIADRTYHRLLHVEWIRADMNGDGVDDYVPQSDSAGAAEPQRAYQLFSGEKPTSTTNTSKPGFYIGGNTYSDWASVPDRYKVSDPQNPDSRRSTASVFKFVW
jgi:polar amino acid transport system substrate-binding protein